MAEFIDAVLSTAPPLSDEQRDRLAVLLRSGIGSGADNG